jgi:HEPN domain-containing protein
MLSDYDIETAKVLIAGKRWVYVAYMCHQALERQLKGMYVYHFDKEAPKTHNLGFLFERITSHPAFLEGIDESKLNAHKEECEDFLAEVMFYYMSDYPFSYKNIVSRFIDARRANELFENVLRIISWLRSLQPIPEQVNVERLISVR